MPLQTEFKKDRSGIQMLYLPAKIVSENVVVDTMKTHLSQLKLIEDMKIDEYVRFVKNSEHEFKASEQDS